MKTESTRTTASANGQGTPKLAIRSTKMTPSSAITDPIDSSMPAVTMTKASAIENSPNRPIRLAVLARLIGDRNRGLTMATIAPTVTTSVARPISFFCIVCSFYSTASRRMFSSVSSVRLRIPVIRPRHITATRSEMPITSSMSDEIIRIATPCPASSCIRW